MKTYVVGLSYSGVIPSLTQQRTRRAQQVAEIESEWDRFWFFVERGGFGRDPEKGREWEARLTKKLELL